MLELADFLVFGVEHGRKMLFALAEVTFPHEDFVFFGGDGCAVGFDCRKPTKFVIHKK